MKFLFISIVFLMACSHETEKNETATINEKQADIQQLDAAAFKAKLETTGNVQLLDVRTPEEWAEGTIQGAEKINFLGQDFVAGIESLDKLEPVFIYCASGNRSARAANQMQSEGFNQIYELKGGITAWKQAGYPISRP